MPDLETADQRRARLAREAEEAARTRALRLLEVVGWDAGTKELRERAGPLFPRLTEQGVRRVVETAERIRWDPTIRKEAKVAMQKRTLELRTMIRRFLEEDDAYREFRAKRVYHCLLERGMEKMAEPTFRKHLSAVRKEMGIELPPGPRPGAEAADHTDAPQRHDTVSDQAAERPEDAPADPDHESPDQDAITSFTDRILDEIGRTEERLRKLRVALEVAREMEGQAA